MPRVAIPIQTRPGRAGVAQVAPVALSAGSGHIMAGGVDLYYFEIINTHVSAAVTVTAVRAACPTCGAVVEPAGNGAVTVAAGLTAFLGPFARNLYGQGAELADIYLDVTGTGTGTIKAYSV